MKFCLIIFCTILISVSLCAQSIDIEVISASGNDGSSSAHQLSWTIGEPIIETHTGSTNVITQGFHQTNLLVTDITEVTPLSLALLIYPNPVVNQLNLSIENPENIPLNYVLYDELGRVVKKDFIDSNPGIIAMDNLARANYMLVVYSAKQIVKTFKVIKMN